MFNQVLFAGRLTKNPEFKEFQNGNKQCRITIAVQRPFRATNGDKLTDFFNVTLWKGLAENVFSHCKTGSLVIVKGRLENNNYTNKEGQQVFTNEIIAERLIYLTTNNKTNEIESDDIEIDSKE
ncbi:single-stranded DNA-binding protein [bacterium]|nr:single-stranded DNA-binding protein [bacterium]